MITDFIEDRRPLVFGGIAFTIRRVPLSAILRAFRRISEATMRELAAQGSEGFDALKVLERFGPEEISEILSWILEPSNPARIAAALKRDEDKPLEYVAALVQQMNDLPRIFRKFGESASAGANGKETSGPGGLEYMLDLVARRYGIPPHQVCEWPFEEVLAILEIAEHEAKMLAGAVEGGGPARRINVGDGKVDPSLIAMLGGEYKAH